MSNRAPHPAREDVTEFPSAELVSRERVSDEPAPEVLNSEEPSAEPGSSEALEVTAEELLTPAFGTPEAAVQAASALAPARAAAASGSEEEPAPDSEPPDSEAEVSEADLVAAELGAGGLPPEGVAASEAPFGSPPPFQPPWVDELPDPVTPYEQRVSETVKVADLPPVEQLRGRVLANRYLAEEVAEQTLASVSYRSYHLALDRAVTVRILPRGLACSDEACQEVRRIAGAASALSHPNIAATLDFGVLSDGWPFVVTEHFQGKTLALLLSQEGKFVLRRVLHIGKQLAAGLRAAHEAGLVHGLLNPDNVLVIEPGTSAEVVTLLGFGISSARGVSPGPPRSGVFGVPFYVSPEQASCRPLDARSDIYSLGIILYELMTGRPPFSDGDFAGVLCQHLDDEAAAPSSRLSSPGALAKAMDAIVQRCLRKDPAMRYQTALELGEDLIRLEAAAARTKRRPMPEVKRPTATIHSPPPKTEGTAAPGAKVIVHSEPEETRTSLPRPESPSGRPASGAPSARASLAPPARGSSPPSSSPGAASSPSASVTPARARSSGAPPALSGPPRARINQATVKISAADRDLVLGHQRRVSEPPPAAGLGPLRMALAPVAALLRWVSHRGAWLLGTVRRLLSSAGRGDDSRRS
jgi:serine/threonine-protein kinase